VVKNGLKIALMFFLVAALPLSAQTENQGDEGVSLEQIDQLRGESEADATLSEETRSHILELCDLASSSLLSATDHRANVTTSESDRKGIDRQLKNLRTDLARHDNRPQPSVGAYSTLAKTEDALARERARLKANRAALRNKERLTEDKAASRAGISQRLGDLDLDLEMLDDELRAQATSAARSELKLAARLSTLARREAALSEIELLRVRLSLLADRSALIPLEIDLARRRVSYREELVTLLDQMTHDLRVEKTQESLVQIRNQGNALTEEVPSLAELSAETIELAEELLAPEGVITQIELTIRSLSETVRHQAQLKRIAELTTRKFEAYGDRGSVKRWWPEIPKDFPRPGAVTREIQDIEERVPEVAHRLITHEQQRSEAHELERETLRDLEARFELNPDLEPKVRALLSVRQDLLDQLIQQLGLYSNHLSDHETAANNFLDHLKEVEFFLFSHILWSRSVPKPVVPYFSDLREGLYWLTSLKQWQSTPLTRIDLRGNGLIAAIALIMLILLRQPMIRRLNTLAERTKKPENDSFGPTVKATVITVLLAAPLPIAIKISSMLAGRMADSTYFISSAEALSTLAVIASFFELTRQMAAPNGLAEAHFGWPAQATRPLFRGLLLTQVASLPLFYVAIQLAYSGIRLDSPADLQLYNNSLGRVAFIAALTIAGLTILSTLRPERKLSRSKQDVRVPWPERFSDYAFPSVFLGAYPVIIFATLVPALLAALGFYVTGLLLAYQMLRTLLLVLGLMVCGGLLNRWRIVSQQRNFLKSKGNEEAEQQRENETTDKQTKHLFRFVIISALAIGLFSIWSDALPMLEMLKRVQLLPRVELLEAPDARAVSAGADGLVTETPPETKPEKGALPTGIAIPGTETSEPASDSKAPKPLTLWNLIEAILAGLATLILVTNLPGVTEIILKHRTTLDGGARFALSALIRYSITIAGTIAVFGLLGIGWSNVQWLAAALTFGLGFGLQEIVANFVSGLILLIERPVRVGDVVTIGTLMGRVNRIQIRATTITLWDRSEMIVPNKEFITTKLVNWTLSDSKRRIDIPLRIAYGSDIEEVKRILIGIAEHHPSVLEEPAPQAVVINFCDDAIKLELRFVVDFGQGVSTKDDVQMSINRTFGEKGINFALPTSEIRLLPNPTKSTLNEEDS